MRVTVNGTDCLGAVHAAAMVELGHEVLGFDNDTAGIDDQSHGRAPFLKPGLSRVLARVTSGRNLRFTTFLREAVNFGDCHSVRVGTPRFPGSYAADLRYLEAVVEAPAFYPHRPALVVAESTVPVGTAARLADRPQELAPVGRKSELAWNPEFLREGFAVQDALAPDRIQVGTPPAEADERLCQSYAPILTAGKDYVGTGLATAERVNAWAGTFSASKISSSNAIAEVCHVTGRNVTTLTEAIGHDVGIGQQLLGIFRWHKSARHIRALGRSAR